MLRSIYTSTAAMLTNMEQTATTANNLANVDTVGFRRDLLLFDSRPGREIWRTDDPTYLDINGRQLPKYMGKLSTGVTDTEIHRDTKKGNAQTTGNPLDILLEGKGFLRVLTPDGERYTRAGNLTVNEAGLLCDHDSNPVLGLGGPISLPQGPVQISREGNVQVDGVAVGALSLAHFDDVAMLEKEGSNLWRNTGSAEEPGITRVYAGVLEGSNVEVSREMVDLITQSRHFEFASKSLQTGDEILNVIVNQLARMPQ
ncbi:MAG: flagellar hook-basal body protein [Planctomycetales bacterium]|nr:flagellar hook-basal body protein [bacterium]UNM07297.1 MAG: flagellar hook-basal body protein [Planctomycetales bacterium]